MSDWMGTLWMTINYLQGGSGQTFQIGGNEVLLVCWSGEMTFPQTDEGHEALRDHDFEAHERVKHYDWTELHGQRVTILVVQRERNDGFPWDEEPRIQTELVARTDDGTYYFLPWSPYDSHKTGDFKWKPQRDGLALLRGLSKPPTRNGREPLLLDSENSDE